MVEPLLANLGRCVRAHRQRARMTRRALAEAAGLSERFLAGIESGTGNLSLLRFRDLSRALGMAPEELLREASRGARRHVALLGLRGAGKSTIGQLLASRLGAPFLELDQVVEQELGMTVGQVFELHGERSFREHERAALRRCVETIPAAVIATGGGIVTDARTLDYLQEACVTVWLRASPEDHWARVVAQGDRRPMAGNPDAMSELRALLAEREPLYARAEVAVDTSSESLESAVTAIHRALGPPAP